MDCPPDHPPAIMASRGRPAAVTPLVDQGVRYEVLANPASEGLPPGAYVVATKVDSSQRLWATRVYPFRVDPNIEADVQWTRLKSIRLDGPSRQLLVEDGNQRIHRLELGDGRIAALRQADAD